MLTLFEQAGIFAWPFVACSLAAVFIIIERLVALRRGNVIPQDYFEPFTDGSIPGQGDSSSVIGRIVALYHNHDVDAEQLKAFARLQITKMERGLFILDIVISAAPLLGLLGTVTGLVKVFSQISPETGVPDTSSFVEGVALALSTTMIGLAIAIPVIVFNSYLSRRIDSYAALIGVGLERLISLKSGQAQRRPPPRRRSLFRHPTDRLKSGQAQRRPPPRPRSYEP